MTMDVEAIIVAVRGAFAADATTEARAAGAHACRAVLAVLEPAVQPNAPVQLNAAAVMQAVTALRGVPADQLLDLAIAKLRGALPAGVQTEPVRSFKFRRVAFSGG
jgi:hypothetical protein